MQILAKDLLRIEEPTKYKLHLACRNRDGTNPLDVYVAGREKWIKWNRWKGTKNDWTREYILALIEFYPKRDTWLFGGIFRVLGREADRYHLQEVKTFAKFEGRLLLSFHRYQGMRGRAYYLESYLDGLKVREVLPERYSGEAFCGFAHIKHDFLLLEATFKSERSDWKSALSNVKGVYLIVDKSNGKSYVGSACGNAGIWSRWACYVGTGHGWNDELTKLIKKNGIAYARTNFQFALLEVMAMTTPDQTIMDREIHWKIVLQTRKFGYNKN